MAISSSTFGFDFFTRGSSGALSENDDAAGAE